MNNKGFTLTEILIVLVVAGILLALILPNTVKAIDRGQVAALRSDLNSIKVALYVCFTESRDWGACDSFKELNDGNFLSDEITTKPPFGVTYNIMNDPGSKSGGQTSCYKGGSVPDDVTSDGSLNLCT